jgi:hypothetical protein
MVALCAAAACNKETPTEPTPEAVIITDVFTGVIAPLGTNTHSVTVVYTYAATNASAIVTSLTSVADGTSKPVTIGLGFGTVNLGACTRVASVTNPVAPFNQELFVPEGTFGPGLYCFQVFDNPAAPTVTEPLNYSITVRHY